MRRALDQRSLSFVEIQAGSVAAVLRELAEDVETNDLWVHSLQFYASLDAIDEDDPISAYVVVESIGRY